MGSDEDTREVVELGRHNAVFRLATGAGEGQGEGAAGLTPLREFEAWARCYEVPTLAEGASLFFPLTRPPAPACDPTDPLAVRFSRRLHDPHPAPLLLLALPVRRRPAVALDPVARGRVPRQGKKDGEGRAAGRGPPCPAWCGREGGGEVERGRG